MEMFRIAGGTRLAGSIRVEGSKNAALPILAASVAITGNVQLEQVPKLQDVTTMSTLLQGMAVAKSDIVPLIFTCKACLHSGRISALNQETSLPPPGSCVDVNWICWAVMARR